MTVSSTPFHAALLALVLAAAPAADADAKVAKVAPAEALELDPAAEAAAEAAYEATGAAGDDDDAATAAADEGADEDDAETAALDDFDDDDGFDGSDDYTVADMMDTVVAADELVDDDDGANEAAEAAALTPTQEEAREIADGYVRAGLAATASDGDANELPATAGEAVLKLPGAAVDKALADASDPAAHSVLEPETDVSRLHKALPFPAPKAADATVDPKHAVVRTVPDPLNPNHVTALQEALKARGLAVRVDGKLGKDTRRALKAYQKGNGLNASGEMDPVTVDSLGVAL